MKVRRPTDYNPSLAATLGPSQPSPHLNLAAVGLLPRCVIITCFHMAGDTISCLFSQS